MKRYIFGARNGIYIIDLQQTVKLFEDAYEFVAEHGGEGEDVLFVGTKKQAQDAVEEEAAPCGMYYVNQRWLGGMLTNFSTIQKSIDRLQRAREDGRPTAPSSGSPRRKPPAREGAGQAGEDPRRHQGHAGKLPGRDLHRRPVARERSRSSKAGKLEIPIVAIVDTNCDPDLIDYVIPGNDDAIRAIKLFLSKMADAILEGKAAYAEKNASRIDKEAEAPEVTVSLISTEGDEEVSIAPKSPAAAQAPSANE